MGGEMRVFKIFIVIVFLAGLYHAIRESREVEKIMTADYEVWTPEPVEHMPEEARAYEHGYRMGCDSGISWRGQGLDFSEKLIEFVRTELWQQSDMQGKKFPSYLKTAFNDGYDNGWRDGYHMITSNYLNIYK